MLVDEKLKPRSDPSAPYAPTFYKDRIVCDQCWSKSALGEEVPAWLQVTSTATYDILSASACLKLNIDMSRPLVLQIKEAIKHAASSRQATVRRRGSKRRKKNILTQVQHNWQKYSRKPLWINKVNATKPTALQVEAFNKQAAEQHVHRLQQNQDSIKDEEHYYNLSHYWHVI